jgi:hypothetical protein
MARTKRRLAITSTGKNTSTDKKPTKNGQVSKTEDTENDQHPPEQHPPGNLRTKGYPLDRRKALLKKAEAYATEGT